MAFSRSFDKSAASAASLLRNFDYQVFRAKLESKCPRIVFDAEAATQTEAASTLDLLVNLVARLYPRISIDILGSRTPQADQLCRGLEDAARRVNENIEIESIGSSSEEPQPTIIVGRTRAANSTSVYYVGSDGWLIKASWNAPVGSGRTSNCFAAGAAACFAAAGLFRMVFGDALRESPESPFGTPSDLTQIRDPDISVSLLTLEPNSDSLETALPEPVVDVGEVFLVGVGAIGNATVWALARTAGLQGTLYLIDKEVLDPTNSQRYVLATHANEGLSKVSVGADEFVRQAGIGSPKLRVQNYETTWANFVSTRARENSNGYCLNRVLLALDTAEDRISAQASLPRWTLNSWTQPENLGISRHPRFDIDPCVACLYLPQGARKPKDALFAEAFGATAPDELMEIRTRLYDHKPVGEPFLRRVAARLQIPFEPLAEYAARPIEAFYTEGLCGGLVLRLGGSYASGTPVEVPMAFQSALAGILLGAELVIDAAGIRHKPLPCRTEINLLRTLGTRLNAPAAKHASGRCICQDSYFLKAYQNKYVGWSTPQDLRT